MDPASAIIGIVSFGFTVFAKVNEIRKSIKGAPQQVQALQESFVVARVLLSKLQTLNTQPVTYTADELACFELLCERSQQCLCDVDEAVKKVMAQTSDANADRTPKVRLLKWFLNKADFEEMTKKLKDVREALGTMVDLMQLNHLQVIAVHVINDVPRRTSSVPNQSLVGIDPSPPRRTGSLQCSHDCTCRCHARFHIPLIPQSLAPYVGQLFISKQLLHPAFTPWNCCNVETCRGTYLKPAKVTYTLPWSLFYGSFQTSSNQRIHFSINAPRTVPYSSPIIQAILSEDVHGVRDLFAKQQASIWDVDINGDSIFVHACDRWQDDPTEDRLEIVRFLVEAGADALFFAETETTTSAHDMLTIGLFSYLLGEHEPGRSLMATIQTNSAAVTVFRSIFNTDAMDALQDVLSRYFGHSDEDISRLLTSLEATEYIMAQSSVFNAIGYTPLEYAIHFSPSSVESLLAEGADVAAEPTLAYAVSNGKTTLIELLIDHGADVNMKDGRGRAALHWACYWCYFESFFELVRCAEDKIDWDARTPEGQNALDVFNTSVSNGKAWNLTSEEINKFRSTLVSHMDPSRLQVVEDEPLNIPGAFPPDT